MGRMSAGPRGAGLGVKLLLGAGALAYGVKEATYTGTCTLANFKVEHLCSAVEQGTLLVFRLLLYWQHPSE